MGLGGAGTKSSTVSLTCARLRTASEIDGFSLFYTLNFMPLIPLCLKPEWWSFTWSIQQEWKLSSLLRKAGRWTSTLRCLWSSSFPLMDLVVRSTCSSPHPSSTCKDLEMGLWLWFVKFPLHSSLMICPGKLSEIWTTLVLWHMAVREFEEGLR